MIFDLLPPTGRCSVGGFFSVKLLTKGRFCVIIVGDNAVKRSSKCFFRYREQTGGVSLHEDAPKSPQSGGGERIYVSAADGLPR